MTPERVLGACLLALVVGAAEPVHGADQDHDGIADAVDLDPYAFSYTFAAPDVCRVTAAPPPPLPIPYPTTLEYGLRRILSDFGDATQGPQPIDPVAIATTDSGEIYVLAPTGLFNVDETSGFRTLVSDFNQPAQGAAIASPGRIAIDESGALLVSDIFGSGSPAGSVYQIDPASGARNLLSDFGDPGQGPVGRFPFGLAFRPSGDVLVTDLDGLLFRVDAHTGVRALMSDLSDPALGPVLAGPTAVAADSHDGDRVLLSSTFGLVIEVDPETGHRSVVSDSSDVNQHAPGIAPIDLTTRAGGGIVVVDPGFSSPGLLALVEPASGIRQVLSDFSFLAQGPLGLTPVGVAAGPSDIMYVVDSDASGAGVLFEVALFGATSGTVMSQGQQKVQVEPSGSHAVKVTTKQDGGSDPAVVFLNGSPVAGPLIPGSTVIGAALGNALGALVSMSSEKEVDLRSGSATIEVIEGPVDVVFVGDEGFVGNATLLSGDGITFEPLDLSFAVPPTSGRAIDVSVGALSFSVAPGGLVAFAQIEIDLKPGSEVNAVNLASGGVVPVALLATSVADGDSIDFDPTRVDPEAVSLAGAGARRKGRSDDTVGLADVDDDGDLDLVLHFHTQELGLTERDASAILVGRTYDGDLFFGLDALAPR